jgi:hypothetical protein
MRRTYVKAKQTTQAKRSVTNDDSNSLLMIEFNETSFFMLLFIRDLQDLISKSSELRIVVGIFSSTIKKNILFNKDYDSQLFRRVIHAAALEEVCLF